MATKKITVTIPEELLEEVRADIDARGLSSYITEAVRAQRDRDLLGELVDWMEEEHGAVTEEEMSAAEAELDDLYAEHMRRRAAQRNEEAA
jgi:Arc/MetJ-type ribon-helix-helix transcriptional regulator